MLFGLIASIISIIKFKILLKKCLVNENDSSNEVFEYQGNKYNKKRYIELRVNAMYQMNPRHLRKYADKVITDIEKGKDIEQNQAELEAIKAAFKKYYPNKEIDF